MNIKQSSNACQLKGLGSDAAENAIGTPEDLLPAAGGSPAVVCPDTPDRQLFEVWVKRRAPIADFTRNANGEYIVIGMQANYMAFVAGWAARTR